MKITNKTSTINHRLFFKILLSFALFSIAAGIFCNKTFFEWFISADGHIVDPLYLGYIFLFRVACISAGSIMLILFSVKKSLIRDWKTSVARFIEMRTRGISMLELLPHPPAKIQVISIIVLSMWAIFVLYGFCFNRPLLASITNENGLTETLTVILYLIAAGLAICRIWHFRSKTSDIGMQRWWLILASLFFILIAMEEINWGQTYLKFNTPDTFHVINYQHEVSLHNIELFSREYWTHHALDWLGALIGIIIPVLLYMFPFIRRLFYFVNIPLPSLTAQYGFIMTVLIPRDNFLEGLFERGNIPSELKEVTLAMSFFLLIWHLTHAAQTKQP